MYDVQSNITTPFLQMTFYFNC